MTRPTVWIDNDLTGIDIKAVHVNNYRDFLIYLQDDFCYSHDSAIYASADSVDNSTERVTVRLANYGTVYSSKYSPVYSTNCSSVYSTDGGC